jgi:alpha-glucuronidase
MKNIRLTVWIGIMCGWLAAGMLQAGTRPDNARPAEEDGSRLWLPVMRPVEGAEVEVIYKGKVSPTIAVAIAELKNAWKGEPVLLEKKRTGQGICYHFFGTSGPYSFIHRGRIALWCL